MSTVTPNFFPGSDTAALNPALEKLVSRPEVPWRLTPSGEGVERSFKFKTFAKTWVSTLCPPSILRAVLRLTGHALTKVNRTS